MPSNIHTALLQGVVKPGGFYGNYPQKKHIHKSKLDRTLEYYWNRAKASCGKTLNDDFIQKIDAEAILLVQQATDQYQQYLHSLRRELGSQGLSEQNVVQSFALVRQLAGEVLSMPHYDCQLLGGLNMLQGKVIEMQTGEGKTLTATLPACCAALAGSPVHIITANDYLVQRDAELMQPLYARMGLSVGYITEAMDWADRHAAYRCDITYCTSQQLVFDYLRDRLTLKSFPCEKALQLESLYSLESKQSTLLLRGLCFAIVDEADSILIDEAMTPLILSTQAEPSTQAGLYTTAIDLARQLELGRHYSIDHANKKVSLNASGVEQLALLSAPLGRAWQSRRRRNSLVGQALTALQLYHRDVDYLVEAQKVNIIDKNTGRVMPDRSWQDDLHQLIEVKEGCVASRKNKTLASISYQSFFQRYHHLSGMSGTLSEAKQELRNVYQLNMDTIPLHKASQKKHLADTVFYRQDDKWQYIVERVKQLDRPVLIGTSSVQDSEILSEQLTQLGLEHQLLNAKQDSNEADIIAAAGQLGKITVATNMAGRGTDIMLSNSARAAGGLHVMLCGHNSARRVDRQLYGRCARQGDPGSYEAVLSLEDSLLSEGFKKLIFSSINPSIRNKHIQSKKLGKFAMYFAQRIIEARHLRLRCLMVKQDDSRNALLGFGESPD